jgi:hypothetical protein
MIGNASDDIERLGSAIRYIQNQSRAIAKTAQLEKSFIVNLDLVNRRREHTWKARGIKNVDGSIFTYCDYLSWVTLQGDICRICAVTNIVNSPWHVDHDHNSGLVRGLLCKNCNLILARAKDNLIIMESGISYLNKHKKENRHGSFAR